MVRELCLPVGYRSKILKRINDLKSKLSPNAQVILTFLCFHELYYFVNFVSYT
jgi:hypothetical protein